MGYEVRVRKRVLKELGSLPLAVQETFHQLRVDLERNGPWQHRWPNYSKLGGGRYHCHLNYGHVACWSYEKNTIIIEVYYVGSRQSAPY